MMMAFTVIILSIYYSLFVTNLCRLPLISFFFLSQLDMNVKPHLTSEYINYLDNPVEVINEAEKAAEKDIWSLMQFTENLRRQYGKEPYSMEILLKKLYVRRMAADLGVSRIYASGKMVGMITNMSKKVYKMITDSMTSDMHRNSLVFENGQIKVLISRYKYTNRRFSTLCIIIYFYLTSMQILKHIYTSYIPVS